MGKKIVILIILLSCLFASNIFADATIDLSKIKTEDLKLEKGQNTSLILGPGSPFSIRLYEGAVVEFDVDGYTNKVIFKKLDQVSTVIYTLDGGKTFREEKIALGDFKRWNITTGSLFVFLNYKIFHNNDATSEKNGVFEIGIPYIQKYNDIPIEVNNSKISTQNDNEGSSTDTYIKYLIGVIIVLILIIIILGPKKKENNEKPSNKEEVAVKEETKKVESKKKAAKKEEEKPTKKKAVVNEEKAEKKNYFTKPKKKPFNEEDVYVVNSSDEE